jgi:hypothetical protein
VGAADHRELDASRDGQPHRGQITHRRDAEQERKERVAAHAGERRSERHGRPLPPIVVEHLEVTADSFDRDMKGEDRLEGSGEEHQREERQRGNGDKSRRQRN